MVWDYTWNIVSQGHISDIAFKDNTLFMTGYANSGAGTTYNSNIKIWSLNQNGTNLTSLNTSVPDNSSKTTGLKIRIGSNKLFIFGGMSDGSFQFGSNTISNTPGNGSIGMILKYDLLFTNILIPNDFILYNSNFSFVDLEYNDNTNNLFVSEGSYNGIDHKLYIYDGNNLSLKSQISIPNTGNNYRPLIDLNENTNKLLISSNKLYTLQDDDNFNLVTLPNTTIDGVDNGYGYLTNLGENNLIFSILSRPNPNTQFIPLKYLTKIDAVTGALLDKSTGTKEEVIKNDLIDNNFIKVFPNPFNNTIQITSTKKASIVNIAILSMFGKTMMQHKTKATKEPIEVKYQSTKGRSLSFKNHLQRRFVRSETNYKKVKLDNH